MAKKGKIVIVNLQSTPLDNQAFLRINGKCEDVVSRLVQKMKLKVRDFVVKRIINFRLNDNKYFQFRGVDKRSVPFSFFRKVFVESEGDNKDIK